MQCEDDGCNDHWYGQGQCINMTDIPWPVVKEAFNLNSSRPEYNQGCRSPMESEDCCVCLKMQHNTCRDTGCTGRGGFCVDIKNANLKSVNIFPRSFVDLGNRIEGAFSQPLCTSVLHVKDCCQCYMRKDALTD